MVKSANTHEEKYHFYYPITFWSPVHLKCLFSLIDETLFVSLILKFQTYTFLTTTKLIMNKTLQSIRESVHDSWFNKYRGKLQQVPQFVCDISIKSRNFSRLNYFVLLGLNCLVQKERRKFSVCFRFFTFS